MSETRLVMVTGAARGIGAAIARAFAADGARVALHCHRSLDAAQSVLDDLPGEQHALFQADLADPDACADLVAAVEADMGVPDVLINNAGVYELVDLMALDYVGWQTSWRRTLATDLTAPANLCFLVGQGMARRGSGRIINISSRGAFRGEPRAPAYGAAKAGLNALTQSLAQALAPSGVFVAAIAPGFVRTDMTASLLDGPEGDDIRAQSPLERVGEPEEIARAAVLLASEGIDFATGAILDMNGASYLRS